MEKKKVGFAIPRELSDALDLLGEQYGGKEKWLVISAAIMSYVRLPEIQRRYLVKEIASTSVLSESFWELIASAARDASTDEVETALSAQSPAVISGATQALIEMAKAGIAKRQPKDVIARIGGKGNLGIGTGNMPGELGFSRAADDGHREDDEKRKRKGK